MRIGDYNVRVFDAGAFRLDGGGMFGVVPWTMWHRLAPPDGRNRIRVSTTCLLLEAPGRRVLVESGHGDKLSEREREIYGVESPGGLLAALRAMDVAPESIDAAVVTHLHFDHAGGLTTLDAAGRPVSALPNARVFVQRREFDVAAANSSHMKTTYRPENFQVLADVGRLELVNGSAEVLPGVRVEPAPGHTPGHQVVLVGDGDGATLAFVGDLIPTRHHLRPWWTMGYDMEPAVVNAARRALVERAIRGRWTLVFPHDADAPAVRVARDESGRWTSEPVAT